jgi:hypothetical protein
MPETMEKAESTQLTDVAGYFNGNSFPIQINMSSIGQTYTLAPGEFITALNEKGLKVKINDPVFDAYVGRNRLSKEVLKGDKKVVLYKIQSRDARGQVHPIQTAQSTATTPDGRPVLPTFAPPQAAVGPNMPVTGMSMEEAYKRGIVKRPRIFEAVGVTETAGAPLNGQNIPEIKYNDADVRQPKPTGGLQLESVPLAVGPKVSLPPPETAVKPVTLPDVPIPTLEDAEEQLESKGGPNKFICELDNPPKSFQFRSQLVDHLKKRYPAQVESYMQRYPKPQPKPANV